MAAILPWPQWVNAVWQKFIHFSIQVKTVSHDINQLTKLLHTVRAIFSNRSLYLEPRPYVSTCKWDRIYHILSFEKITWEAIWYVWWCHKQFFSCDQAALWMVQSVRLSVRLSVCHTFLTMFPSSYRHEIFRSYYQWQKWRPCKRSRSEVKGQGHRGHNPT